MHAATISASFKILIAQIMTKVRIFVLVGFAVASFWFANAKLCSKSSFVPEDRDKYVYTNQVRAGKLYSNLYMERIKC